MTETERALDELAALLEGGGLGGKRPNGGSRYLLLPAAPTLYFAELKFDAFRRITGFWSSATTNVAITKNGMSIGAGQVITDHAGNVQNAPLDISAGNILFCGSAPTTPVLGLNFPVHVEETLFVSKNTATVVPVIVYFDYE